MNPEHMSPELQKRLDISRAKADEKAMDFGGTEIKEDGSLIADPRLVEHLHREGDENINRVRTLENREVQADWNKLVDAEKRVEREYAAYYNHLRDRQRTMEALAEAAIQEKPMGSLVESLKDIDKDKIGTARQSVEWFMQDVNKFLEKLNLKAPFMSRQTDEIVLNFRSEYLLELIDQARRAEMQKSNEVLGREINF